VAPKPARSWHFPAVTVAADQTIIDVNNPNNRPAVVRVSINGKKQKATLPANGEAEMELGPSQRTARISVHSTLPIVVARLVTSKGKTYTTYGSHT
jgi:hypothetical protein